MLLARLGFPSSRGHLPFMAAMVVDTVGTGLFMPISLLYFTQVVDLSLSIAGPLVTAATGLSLPLPAVVGALVDRVGARRVVLAGQLLQAAGMAGYLVFRSPWLLFVAAMLVAAGQRIFWSSFFTLVADVAAPAERDRWYGLTVSLQSAASASASASARSRWGRCSRSVATAVHRGGGDQRGELPRFDVAVDAGDRPARTH